MNKRICYFCAQNIKEIDYKNTEILGRHISLAAKIRPRKKTACCAKHQRQLAHAIKRARHLGLMPISVQ